MSINIECWYDKQPTHRPRTGLLFSGRNANYVFDPISFLSFFFGKVVWDFFVDKRNRVIQELFNALPIDKNQNNKLLYELFGFCLISFSNENFLIGLTWWHQRHDVFLHSQPQSGAHFFPVESCVCLLLLKFVDPLKCIIFCTKQT